MIEAQNPYAVLGVTPVATLAEINHAFRAKLRALHPDTRHSSAGATASDAQLQQLIAAYHLLRNPEIRARPDRNVTAAAAPPRRQGQSSSSHDVSVSTDEPLTILVTDHRSQARAASYLVWAGPVRRHR